MYRQKQSILLLHVFTRDLLKKMQISRLIWVGPHQFLYINFGLQSFPFWSQTPKQKFPESMLVWRINFGIKIEITLIISVHRIIISFEKDSSDNYNNNMDRILGCQNVPDMDSFMQETPQFNTIERRTQKQYIFCWSRYFTPSPDTIR